MTTTTHAIGAMWIRIQEVFLNHPAATLTSEQVRLLAATDSVVCEAVLDALVDSGVVERKASGYRLATPAQLAA